MKSFYLKNVKFEFKSYDGLLKKYTYFTNKNFYIITENRYRKFTLSKINTIYFYKSKYNYKILSCIKLEGPYNGHLINLNSLKRDNFYYEFFNNIEKAEEKIKILNLFQ